MKSITYRVSLKKEEKSTNFKSKTNIKKLSSKIWNTRRQNSIEKRKAEAK